MTFKRKLPRPGHQEQRFAMNTAMEDASNDPRLEQLERWLGTDLALRIDRIAPASVDASFRRYFRIWRDGETHIVMDAPPEKIDVRPFMKVAAMLHDIGVSAPRILASDVERGFLLLTDLGTRLYLDDLAAGRNVDALYGDAMHSLCAIQARGAAHAVQLLPYDRESLLREMQLLPEWLCERHLGLTLSGGERAMFADTFATLCASALAQPQGFVHRDYHSRNLTVLPQGNPGILDFQDAVRGPVTYDLAGLFRDVYVSWPDTRVRTWVLEFRALASAAGVDVGPSDEHFVRWFDLMGAQRHIKILGLFARLFHRDGKPRYLGDLPLTLDYVRRVTARYPELAPMDGFLAQRVAPVLARRTAEALS